jgi:hypothetical protein
VDNPDFKLTITNSVSGSQGPTKIDLFLPSDTTIQTVLQQCAESIFPKRPVRELNLTYKGRDLKEPLKSLREISTQQPMLMILSSKTEIELEYEEMGRFQQTNNDQQLTEAIANLKEFLGGSDLPDKVIGLALKKCNLDLSEAISMIIDADIVASLEA